MYKKIAYVFTGRTGSTAMFKSYRNYPDDFIVEGEFIAGIAKSFRKPEGNKTYDGVESAWAAQRAKIVDLFEGGPDDPRARIFKTKLQDVLDVDGFRSLLEDSGAHVVACWRENIVKYVISTIRAQKLREKVDAAGMGTESFPSNYTTKMKDRGIEPVSAVHVEPDFLMKRLRAAERARDNVKSFAEAVNAPVLAMPYEDYVADLQQGLDRIRDFTGTPTVRLSGKIIKHTPDDLEQAISNYAEIRDVLSGTRFEGYLA
ncbi:MAG: hypothetical protein D6773_19520 [Alphaproteobacteria bacterium]|nr:MAG: hypothetical protein D6773_19520 [Alphaproteobacteria bacterium]